MAEFEFTAAITAARTAASAASYDVQKLAENSIERQALHNIITALDNLIDAVDSRE